MNKGLAAFLGFLVGGATGGVAGWLIAKRIDEKNRGAEIQSVAFFLKAVVQGVVQFLGKGIELLLVGSEEFLWGAQAALLHDLAP